MKQHYKLFLLIFLLTVSLGFIIPTLEPQTALTLTQVTDSSVPQDSITNYEELSTEEKQVFRELLEEETRILESNENILDRDFVKLDGIVYSPITETVSHPLSLPIGVLTLFTFLELYVSVFQLLQQQNLSYQDQIIAVILIASIFIFIPVDNTNITTNTPEIQLSTQPIEIEDNIQNQTITSKNLTQPVRNEVYTIMKGGTSVSLTNATYKTLDTAKNQHLKKFKYIQSDGEYYHINNIDKTEQNFLFIKLLLGILFTFFIIFYTFIVRYDSFKEK